MVEVIRTLLWKCIFTVHSKKQYQKLPARIQQRFDTRLALFIEQPDNALLRVHRLSGNRYPLYSLNVTADHRALFDWNGTAVTFHEIGTHTELYD